MHKTDEELMMGYKSGQNDCLEELFNRYKKPIFNFSLRLLANRADAEEAVSQLFYTLTVKKEAYAPQAQAKFSTWFYTVTRNICLDIIRRRKRTIFMWSKRDQDDGEAVQWDIPDAKNIPDVKAQERDCAEAIKKAMDRLPYEMKEAIVLREYQQLSYEEIGKVLGCTLEKVKILIFRAREKLRVELLPFIEEAGNV